MVSKGQGVGNLVRNQNNQVSSKNLFVNAKSVTGCITLTYLFSSA